MKRYAVSLCLLLTLPLLAYEQQIKVLAGQLTEKLISANRRTVAVVDFTDLQGNTTELGRFLSEELSVALSIEAKGFNVIDRTHLKTVLQENKLGASGIIDPATARQLGKIAGVDALVTGTLTSFGESVRVSVKILDTQTAAMIGAATSDVPKTKAIEELMARDVRGIYLPQQAAGAVPSRATPGQSSEKAVYQNDALRVTAGDVGVTPENMHAGFSATVENISREAVYVAVEDPGFGKVAQLTDDRGTNWSISNFTGLEVLPIRKSEKYATAIRSSENFTMIAAGGRVAIVMQFYNPRRGTPGSVFAFSLQGVRHTTSGVSRFSVGLTGMRGTTAIK